MFYMTFVTGDVIAAILEHVFKIMILVFPSLKQNDSPHHFLSKLQLTTLVTLDK